MSKEKANGGWKCPMCGWFNHLHPESCNYELIKEFKDKISVLESEITLLQGSERKLTAIMNDKNHLIDNQVAQLKERGDEIVSLKEENQRLRDRIDAPNPHAPIWFNRAIRAETKVDSLERVNADLATRLAGVEKALRKE